MTKSPKVLILAHRFWPEITDDTLRLIHWIERLNKSSFDTHVLTSKAETGWSSCIYFDRTRVDRVTPNSANPFRSQRYTREIQDRVAAISSETSLIYVDSVRAEATAVTSRWKRDNRPPVLVRYDVMMQSRGDPNRFQPSKAAMDVCRKATAIIAPCAASHQNLIAQGIVQTPILRIDDWHGKCIDRSLGARRAARGILGNVNHDLYIRPSDTLIVCPGELSREWGVEALIQAMTSILELNRRVKLWILGDGRQRSAIYRLLEQHNLHRVVAMPGIFSDLEQVLQVADLCVFPARGQGLSWLAPTCAASNIPMILTDGPGAERFCGEEERSLMLCSNGSSADLRYKIESWLRNPTPLARVALRLQRVALAHQERSPEIPELSSLIRRPSAGVTCMGS